MTLKDLLGDELEAQVQAKIDAHNAGITDKAKQVRLVDLSEGGYVGREKFNDKVTTLTQQVTDLKGQVAERDTDLADLNVKLTAAQADAGKLTDAQAALTGLQSRYDAEKKQWEEKNAQQAYEYMVRERASGLQFSSTAAKKEFIREAISKGFKVDGENLLGYSDFVDSYKAADPGAFKAADPAPDPQPNPQPTIVLPGHPTAPPKTGGLAAMMQAKNANPGMVVNFDN